MEAIMKRLWILPLLVGCLAIGQGALAQTKELVAGSVWRNQSGSLLEIQQINPDMSISGSYINKAPGFQCQGTPYPMAGWIIGSAISFTVLWDNSYENCNSVTGWSGFYYNGEIETKWNLAVSGARDPKQILSGEDVFAPYPEIVSESLLK